MCSSRRRHTGSSFGISISMRSTGTSGNQWDFGASTPGQTTIRAYSLANPPAESDRAMLVVRIALPPANAPPGTPPGCVSSYIYSLKPGAELAVSGPFGEFHASESGREMVLIAGGVGIAPIRSIIFDQLARRTGRKMTLWHGARTERDVCYLQEFRQAAQHHENFAYHLALSGPGVDPGWQGHRGFIHTVVYEEFLRSRPPPQELEYYLCGPPLMASSIVQMLEELGVPSDRVFFDDFGS
jgi:Na+-transporting NADH:ubiquinone oxidoreductase subunit F